MNAEEMKAQEVKTMQRITVAIHSGEHTLKSIDDALAHWHKERLAIIDDLNELYRRRAMCQAIFDLPKGGSNAI